MSAEVTLRLTGTTMLEPVQEIVDSFAPLDPGEAHLVIEVAASSLAYDKGLKARLHVRHRVRELWVVDANERITWVHTGPNGEGWSSVVKCGPQRALAT